MDQSKVEDNKIEREIEEEEEEREKEEARHIRVPGLYWPNGRSSVKPLTFSPTHMSGGGHKYIWLYPQSHTTDDSMMPALLPVNQLVPLTCTSPVSLYTSPALSTDM